MQLVNNVCPDPQGLFEPIVCMQGYFCPRGYHCPQGSYKPKKGSVLSICQAGSMREISLAGLLPLAAIYLFCIALITGLKKMKSGKRRKNSASFTELGAGDAGGFADMSELPNGTNLSASAEMAEGEQPGSQTCEFFRLIMEGRNTDKLGIAFQFHDLNYTLSDVSRSILRGIFGQIGKGCMFRIMGPSGAGMTFQIQATNNNHSLSQISRFAGRKNQAKLWVRHGERSRRRHPRVSQFLGVGDHLLFFLSFYVTCLSDAQCR